MLKNMKELLGFSVRASDGYAGRAEEFYFSEESWRIEQLLIEAGDWLSHRHVMVPVGMFKEPDWRNRLFLLNVGRAFLEKQPDIETYQAPVSNVGGPAVRNYPVNVVAPHLMPRPSELNSPQASTAVLEDDLESQRLLGAATILGYGVQAQDGPAGKIEDLIFDDVFWDIRYIVVNIGDRQVLVSPAMVEDVRPYASEIRISLLRENVAGSRRHDALDLSHATTSRTQGKPWLGKKPESK
jgi:hypothetical protein